MVAESLCRTACCRLLASLSLMAQAVAASGSKLRPDSSFSRVFGIDLSPPYEQHVHVAITWVRLAFGIGDSFGVVEPGTWVKCDEPWLYVREDWPLHMPTVSSIFTQDID